MSSSSIRWQGLMPSLPTRTITGPFSCPAWLVLWVICGARFCDVAGVFSTLSLLTFPVSALVSAALWVKVRTSKFVLGRFSANLDDVGLSPLMFLPRNVRARRGDLWPFSSPHHASCGLSHNLVSFSVSCSVFGEPSASLLYASSLRTCNFLYFPSLGNSSVVS